MSFPRYPEYKDSGVEWLGEVPAHWDVTALKRGFNVTLGKMLQPESNNPDDELLPYLRAANIQWGGVDTTDIKQMWLSKRDRNQLRLEIGDLLVSEGGDVGRSCLWAAELDDCYFQNSVNRVRARSGSSNRYLYYWMSTIKDKGYIDVLCNKSTIAHFTAEKVAAAPVPFPTLPEQTKIAAFLDRETLKIDALVAEQRRLSELLKEKRQAVISHAVTKGLNPAAPMKPSGIEWLGDVPAHWTVIVLKRIADVQTGVAKGKDNSMRTRITVPYLRVANVQNGYLDLETIATIEIPEEDLARYSLKPGDVLMNEGGDFDKLGRGHVWDGQIDPCITQNHVFAVRPRKVSSAWLNAITGSDFAQFYFMTRSKQSTNLASISSTNLMELPVILPPVDEQQAILSFIADQTSHFDTLTAEAQRAIDLLQERRSALIAAAVTGQMDVRQHEPLA
ncbi:MAG: restriction endonuclease subunit S [Acidithiobacillus sp.]